MAFHDTWKEGSGYTKVSIVSQETAIEDTDIEEHHIPMFRRSLWPNRLAILLTAANIVLFLLTVAMVLAHRKPTQGVMNAALRDTSSYSPVFDMVDLEPSIRRINGSLYPAGGRLSIARQFPNPIADAAWEEDIELIRPIPITREQIVKLGKNPDTVAKLEDDTWGLGDDAYVAALDVFHNLHCLNTLRQAAYANYYEQRPAEADHYDWNLEIHLNHCADILYQTISCSNNVNLVTRHWTEGKEYPFPDFSINKQCINFEKLVEWHKGASVTINMTKYIEVMKKPQGVKEEPKQVWHPDEWFQKNTSMKLPRFSRPRT